MTDRPTNQQTDMRVNRVSEFDLSGFSDPTMYFPFLKNPVSRQSRSLAVFPFPETTSLSLMHAGAKYGFNVLYCNG